VSPSWVLFDLNGTLVDPTGIGEPLGLDASDSLAALDEAVMLAMAETLSGEWRPLPDFLRAALLRRARVDGRPDRIDEAMERASRMPPYPDAAAALDRLRGSGLAVGVLTNSETDAAERTLGAAGLRDRLSLVVGVDSVRAFKPDPRVYRLGAERAGAPPEDIWMVAAHWWDLLGASRAGMRTAWVAQKEHYPLETDPPPDVAGDDLLAVAELLASS
jgi:2-haloacid dehalogenase